MVSRGQQSGIDTPALEDLNSKTRTVVEFLQPHFGSQNLIVLAEWFAKEQHLKITEQVATLVDEGSASVPLRFANWMLFCHGEKEGASVPGWQRGLGIEQASTVLEIMNVSEEYSGSAAGQNFHKSQEERLVLPSRRDRLGIGATIDPETRKLKTLVAVEDDGPLYDDLLKMRDDSGDLEVCKVGFAQIGSPDPSSILPSTISMEAWCPGRPVAHVDGSAGSLTAFVECVQDDETYTGFLGAAHVLTNMARAQKGDGILSPAPPFVERDLRYEVGTLQGGEKLVHYKRQNDPLRVIHRTDIASVMLQDDTLPVRNMVPDPENQEDFVAISGFVTENELIEYVHTDVHKNGVGSGFTTGKLIGIDVLSFIVKMPDGKNYLFGDLMLIESMEEDNRRFSRRGDSGALIYNASGEALGVVIGGSGRFTFAQPIERCLTREGARLK